MKKRNLTISQARELRKIANQINSFNWKDKIIPPIVQDANRLIDKKNKEARQ